MVPAAINGMLGRLTLPGLTINPTPSMGEFRLLKHRKQSLYGGYEKL
jgi:hypothetical protein